MNTVSGKVAEGLHLDAVKLGTADEFATVLTKDKKANIVDILPNGKVQFTYKKSISEEITKQKPIALSFYIYEYARCYMFEHAYSKIGLDKLLYTDTDAAKLREKDAGEFLQYSQNNKVPHWECIEEIDPRYKEHNLYNPKSKVFGSFENELDDGPHNQFYCLQKKFWVCLQNGEVLKIKGKMKIGSKGINPKSVMMTFATEEEAKKYLETKNVQELYYEINQHQEK